MSQKAPTGPHVGTGEETDEVEEEVEEEVDEELDELEEVLVGI
jgi:hypothetical protein